MSKIEAFEKYADSYDKWFEKNNRVYNAEIEVIRQIMPSSEGKWVEVGVGSGKFSEPLGIKTGIEPSEKMAAKAKERGIKVFPGMAEDLPFPDNDFDLVLMVTTICFVDDINRSFQEVRRVLKNGGSIIVGFVDKESGLGKEYLKNRDKSKFYKDAVFFSTEEVLKYLNDAGFDITKIKQTLIAGKSQETILDGYGKGAFVVIRGDKIDL